jgi:uncharacterized Zn finger protein (UPF0148 family)
MKMVVVRVQGEVTCKKCGHIQEVEIEDDVDIEPRHNEAYE